MKTSPHQYDIMLTFMEQYGDLSKPFTNIRDKIMTKQYWAKLTSLLNSEGNGRIKTTEKWRKAWSDIKDNTKRKTIRLHREASKGGPPVYLSPLEHRILNVMGLPVETDNEAGNGWNVHIKDRLSDFSPSETDPVASDTSMHEVYIINVEGDEVKTEIEPSNHLHINPPPQRSTSLPIDLEDSDDTEDDTPHDISQSQSKIFIQPQQSQTKVFIQPKQSQPKVFIQPKQSQPKQSQSKVIIQPALSGQTRPRRIVRVRERDKTRRLIRSADTEPSVQQFFQPDAQWREFKMQQHLDYMELKREQNRIRVMEVKTQKEWQTVGLKALDVLDKLVTNYCKDSN